MPVFIPDVVESASVFTVPVVVPTVLLSPDVAVLTERFTMFGFLVAAVVEVPVGWPGAG
jgi:hypothetical protein